MNPDFQDVYKTRDMLRDCFNAVADRVFDHPTLVNMAGSTLAASGLADDMAVPEILTRLEPIHTGLIIGEAQQMISLGRAHQQRIRLLLRDSRIIYGASDDAAYTEAVPDITAEIQGSHEVAVPYLYQTAGNFLTAAASYPSAGSFQDDIQNSQGELNVIAQEHDKLHKAMLASPMNEADLAQFYAPYVDMSANPVADYRANTARHISLNVDIAQTCLTRLGLRITQAYLCMRDDSLRQVIDSDPVLKADFATKFQETRNAFERIDIHMSGAQMTGGFMRGAEQFEKTALRI